MKDLLFSRVLSILYQVVRALILGINNREHQVVKVVVGLDIAEEAVLDKLIGLQELLLIVFLEAIENLDENSTDGRIEGQDDLSASRFVLQAYLKSFFRAI